MSELDEAERRLKRTLRSTIATHPFFGTLALFADYRFDDDVETAATDGQTIWISPKAAIGLASNEFSGLLMHELLHCALDHVGRRGQRDPLLWNVAADIVVNGMIRSAGKFALPEGSIQDWSLGHLSVEEVYEQVKASGSRTHRPTLVDVRLGGVDDSAAPSTGPGSKGFWRNALEQALMVARRRDQSFGDKAGAGYRELVQLREPQLPWTQMLWQFVTLTPTDFSGFDRRFLWRGLYLDATEQESVRLKVAIDTSGSITGFELSAFMSELLAILRAYPHVEGECYFADARVHGPYALDEELLTRKPEGGGGTSFEPFFNLLKDGSGATDLCLYFTDGHGGFPCDVPSSPVLWIVTPGGLATERFPFGEVARMGLLGCTTEHETQNGRSTNRRAQPNDSSPSTLLPPTRPPTNPT